MTTTWEERIATFWSEVGEHDAEDATARLSALVAERPAGDPDALFETASLHDYLGEESAAIPVYRAALAAGLSGHARSQALIQLGSSLRNVGDASGAIGVLKEISDDDPLAAAAQAFLTLALHDDDKPTEGLRRALTLLAPHLPAYSRSVSAYAEELGALERIRVIAVGLLVDGDRVLVEEYPANGRHAGFLRLPGGGVQFGETALAAVHREFGEELGVTLDSAHLLGVTENIFDSHGKRGHEIVHVFGVHCRELSQRRSGERVPVRDSDTFVAWHPTASLAAGSPPLYPAGVLDLLARTSP